MIPFELSRLFLPMNLTWSEWMKPDDWSPAPRGTLEFTDPIASVVQHADGWLVTLTSGREFAVELKQ